MKLFAEYVNHELPSQLQQHGDLVQRQQVQVRQLLLVSGSPRKFNLKLL